MTSFKIRRIYCINKRFSRDPPGRGAATPLSPLTCPLTAESIKVQPAKHSWDGSQGAGCSGDQRSHYRVCQSEGCWESQPDVPKPTLARPEQSFPPQVLFHLAPDFPWERMRAMAKPNAVTASVVDSPRIAGWRLR